MRQVENRRFFRKFRRQNGMTLNECAIKTDLSESMLSRFENGERDLSPVAWARLSELIKYYGRHSDAIAQAFPHAFL